MDLQDFLNDWHNGSPTVPVHTSGSTGAPKPLRVEKRRMEASARLTCDFLGLAPGDTALLCMPLDYIAGKMMVVRSLVRGLRLVSVKPSSRPLAGLDEVPVFAAMVPMQVACSLHCAKERRLLMGIRHLIIGGGAVDKALEKELRSFPNAVWSTYGMTETLSHIALRRLSGPDADSWYTPFTGVGVSLGADGCLVIDAPLVCDGTLHTNDFAELHPDGRRFRILGRKDNVINSGGVKIRMEDVERLLSPHLHAPFVITKRRDARLGEAVAMVFEGKEADVRGIRAVCENVLPEYWRPRTFVAVDKVPLTGTGKPARAEAQRMAEASTGPVVRHETVVVGGQQAVLLVPLQLALAGFLVCCSIFLRASGVDVDEVAVGVIFIGVAVSDFSVLAWSRFRAVVHVADIGKLELLSFILSVGVRKVVAHVERAVELQVCLRQVLALRRDAVHVVIAHRERVACRLAVSARVGAGCA